ncbi:hypothetical protein RHGRI_005698 [Rhododendron griersonianum]|uniref:Protein CHUP1, chloroplastic n=1 Tax=Rhododendron griersonianum TaxID=479676 RepID=A0AAV6LF87_9ERIC|nr:hypothetical protein RHGRI_005698 [Rhododendron griersonianum]
MKQEVSPTATTASTTATKPQGNPRAAASSRLRASSKPKDSHSAIGNNNNGNRVSPPLLPKPTPNSKPVLANKPKPRSGVEQFSRPTRRQHTPDLKNSDLGGKKELDEEVDQEKKKSETLIRDLQTETTPTFKDIQKLIATKLDHSKVTNESTSDARPTTRALMAPGIQSVPVASADLQRKVAACHLPPPPPPPLPPRATLKGAIVPKAPIISLSGSRNHDKPVVMSAHSNLVGEIQKRSTHLLAIKTDIETKGEFVNSLIQKVLDAAYSDIEDVLQFVDWLDDQLLSLADERAVLKHFKWPEKKADAMREAAVEYRGLKLLESELSSHKDDPTIPCGVAFKKMAGLLDKSEKSIQRLIKLRTSVMLSYQQFKIPIDWILDSGFISKIKQGSMMLAKIYLRRVTMELESAQYLERESTQEGLLLQGIHFAYKVHQFAGGLDSETLRAFEEIRRRVPGHLRESQALLTGIPST